MANVQDIQASEFDAWLANSPLAIADFTASWCGPCKLVAPLMEKLADTYAGQVAIAQINIDNNKPLAQRFGLKSIPAVLIFKFGEPVETFVGVKPYETYSQALEQYL